jgi:hypothetical protein
MPSSGLKCLFMFFFFAPIRCSPDFPGWQWSFCRSKGMRSRDVSTCALRASRRRCGSRQKKKPLKMRSGGGHVTWFLGLGRLLISCLSRLQIDMEMMIWIDTVSCLCYFLKTMLSVATDPSLHSRGEQISLTAFLTVCFTASGPPGQPSILS